MSVTKKYDVKPEHHRLWIQKDFSVALTTNIGDGFPSEFIIADDRSRILYLAAQINSNLPFYISNRERKMILEDSLNEYLPEMNYIEFVVDSDSTWLIPKLKNSNHPPHQYIDRIKYTLLNNKVIITSNTIPNELKPLLSEFHELDDILVDTFGFYCMEEGENYLLFNKTTGEMIKLDSSLHRFDFPISHPQFVNLMITDKCGNSCLYCSRDSVPNGRSAFLKDIKNCISIFQDMNVSEILISGGDFISYPEFTELIKYLRNQKEKTDIVFNSVLPLRSFELRNREIDKRMGDILTVFSEVSFPVDYSRGVREFIEKYKRMFDMMNMRYHVRIMPEMMILRNQRELFEIVQICKYFGIILNLIGLKNLGRGKNAMSITESDDPKGNIDKMLEILFDNGKPNYIADEKFIENFPEARPYIPNYQRILKKGKVTCTVDLIRNTISKYPYSKTKIPFDIDGSIMCQVENAFPYL